MSGPADTVAPWPVPTEPGFYWRRVLDTNADAEPCWRWVPAEVYRFAYRSEGPLLTNNYGLDGIVWGPRIEPPPEPSCPEGVP